MGWMKYPQAFGIQSDKQLRIVIKTYTYDFTCTHPKVGIKATGPRPYPPPYVEITGFPQLRARVGNH
jgi:hypothetical protein